MEATPVAVVGATALIGDALERVAPATVCFVGDEIVAAGPMEEVVVPSDATVVDGAGQALLPGFIDAHVHIGLASPRAVVEGGVTTVRDLGWPLEIFELVARSRAASFPGPTVTAAGPMLTVAGGYPLRAAWAPPGTGLDVAGAGGPERAVDMVAARGAAVVKVALNAAVGPTLDAIVLAELVAAAHARGLRVTGHVWGLAELHKALDAGMDELAHMLMSPDAIPDDTIARMVEASVRIVPTLAIFSGDALRRALENLARFLARGGRVVYGTDLGNVGPRPGIDPREVRALSRAGMSAHDIIAAATTDSAGWLGLDGCGVIVAGARADLVALPEAALTSAEALSHVARVWRRGRAVR